MSVSGDKKVLIIEDEALVARELELRLSKLGYVVVGVAATGEEAFRLAEKYRPDIILADIHIKGDEDGIAVSRRIRVKRDVPVVFLTAYSDTETVARAKEVTPYGYIIKPVENRELEVAIEIALYKSNVERELGETRELLAMALQCIGTALIFVDHKGVINQINSEMLSLLATDFADESGRLWYETLRIGADSGAAQLISQAIKSSSLTRLSPFVLVNRENQSFLVDGMIGPMLTGHVLIFRNITPLNDDIEKLSSPSGSGSLFITGKNSFVQMMIAADLGDKESVLSANGNFDRDGLMKEIEKIINQSLRSTDMASRYGDKLLIASLPYTSLEEGEAIAANLLDDLSVRKFQQGKVVCTFSIGLAQGVQGDADPFELLRRASKAMEIAREKGVNKAHIFRHESGSDLQVLRQGNEGARSYAHVLLLWNLMNTLGRDENSGEKLSMAVQHIERLIGLRSVFLFKWDKKEISLMASSMDTDSGVDTDWRRYLDKQVSDDMEKLILPVSDDQLHGEDHCIYRFQSGSENWILLLNGSSSLETQDFVFVEGMVNYLSAGIRALVDEALDEERDTQWLDSRKFVYESDSMKSLVDRLSMVAPTDATVLLSGESGTGKEMVASLIHEMSDRRNKPFVIVDCGAVVDSLIESELFGHVKGAFTGAVSDSSGRLREADGGTLMLDEIGELPLEVQSRLLRFVQDKKVMPVGGKGYHQVDTRLIAATNRNLKQMVDEGSFREDLFYRLNVFSVELPPLRERKSDIPALATHFLNQFAMRYHKKIEGFSPEAMNLLLAASWKGNVRELSNLVNRSVILCKDSLISPIHMGLYDSFPGGRDERVSWEEEGTARSRLRNEIAECIRRCTRENEFPPLGIMLEKDLILAAQEKQGGVSSKTAAFLNLPETTLRRKLIKINEEMSRDAPARPDYWEVVKETIPSYLDFAAGRRLAILEDCQKIVMDEARKQTSNRSKIANLLGVSQPTYRKMLGESDDSP